MKKLSANQTFEFHRLREALKTKREAFEAAGAALQEVANEASEFVAQLEADARAYFDDKSEKWQEGDTGQAYDAWVETLGEIANDLGSVDVDLQDDDAIDHFDDMPTEPEA